MYNYQIEMIGRQYSYDKKVQKLNFTGDSKWKFLLSIQNPLSTYRRIFFEIMNLFQEGSPLPQACFRSFHQLEMTSLLIWWATKKTSRVQLGRFSSCLDSQLFHGLRLAFCFKFSMISFTLKLSLPWWI